MFSIWCGGEFLMYKQFPCFNILKRFHFCFSSLAVFHFTSVAWRWCISASSSLELVILDCCPRWSHFNLLNTLWARAWCCRSRRFSACSQNVPFSPQTAIRRLWRSVLLPARRFGKPRKLWSQVIPLKTSHKCREEICLRLTQWGRGPVPRTTTEAAWGKKQIRFSEVSERIAGFCFHLLSPSVAGAALSYWSEMRKREK